MGGGNTICCRKGPAIDPDIESHIKQLNDEEEYLKSYISLFVNHTTKDIYNTSLISNETVRVNQIGTLMTNISEVNLHIKEMFDNVDVFNEEFSNKMERPQKKLYDEYIYKLELFWDKYYRIKEHKFMDIEFISNFIMENNKTFNLMNSKKKRIFKETY